MTVDVQRFQGGRAWITRAGIAGLVALAITFAGMPQAPKEVFFSYLLAFCYWAGIAFASLILLMIFHAFHAKWMVVIRRPLEIMAGTVLLFLPLFAPIALLGMEHLYSWVNPGQGFTHHEMELLHRKHTYLNVPFFLIRTVIYFLVAIALSQRFFGLSTRQDTSGDIELTARQRRLGAGGLPIMAIVFSFAAFDWLMSLDPLWFSTIFGVYYFAGSFLSTIAMLVIVSNTARGKDLFGDYVTPEHSHNLGKLSLAFTAFWAYIAFSQFMLIWIANLPEEIPFFIIRMKGPWAVVGIFLMVGHFAIPFFALLSRELKRKRKLLGVVASWILFVHFIDLYWLVFPTFSPEGPVFHWSLITAFLGVGLLAIAFAIWRIRGHFTVPVRDPFLPVSLGYRQP